MFILATHFNLTLYYYKSLQQIHFGAHPHKSLLHPKIILIEMPQITWVEFCPACSIDQTIFNLLDVYTGPGGEV